MKIALIAGGVVGAMLLVVAALSAQPAKVQPQSTQVAVGGATATAYASTVAYVTQQVAKLQTRTAQP